MPFVTSKPKIADKARQVCLFLYVWFGGGYVCVCVCVCVCMCLYVKAWAGALSMHMFKTRISIQNIQKGKGKNGISNGTFVYLQLLHYLSEVQNALSEKLWWVGGWVWVCMYV
jgi:hypothetical protein